MTTEIETHLTRHSLVEFWGGDKRGICLQVTCRSASTPDSGGQEEGYIQLTMAEAAILAKQLADFALREAERRQGLLREQIKSLQDLERTVFGEVSTIRMADYATQELSVALIDVYCPKVRSAEK